MTLLKGQRTGVELFLRIHYVLFKKHILVAVIEVLNHAISPRFGHRNEPRLNTMVQAKAYKRSHPTRMSHAAKETHGIINL
ncbi:hypothetical protein SMITH_666 [Smithella sp. ME-1]|nr:hypothetical protein SMITH_666 [Smithella sp. ME-1]